MRTRREVATERLHVARSPGTEGLRCRPMDPTPQQGPIEAHFALTTRGAAVPASHVSDVADGPAWRLTFARPDVIPQPPVLLPG